VPHANPQSLALSRLLARLHRHGGLLRFRGIHLHHGNPSVNHIRAALTGALLLCLSAHAVRAEKTGKAPVAASTAQAKAECIKAPDAAQEPADKGRPPEQAFRSEPPKELASAQSREDEAKRTVAITVVGGILLLAIALITALDSGDEPDSANGLRTVR
jgi:hypothetical protein